MSTPNPFTIDDEHWALINAFVNFKANEDGVTDPGEQVDLIRQYWLLLVDKAALQTEVEVMELEDLEATVLVTKQAVIDQEQEVADRKAGRPPPRVRTVTPAEEASDPVAPEIFNEEARAEAEAAAVEAARVAAAAASPPDNPDQPGPSLVVNDDDNSAGAR